MTDNEIIKALKCCKTPVGSGACNSCPLKDIRDNLRKEDAKSCTTIMIENALDLIKSQKAEIEKKDVEIDILIRKNERLKDEVSELRAEIERLNELVVYNASCCSRLHKDLFNAKSEGRKELAERLKDKAEKTTWISSGEFVVKDYKISRKDLDNLLAEMESERE